MQKIKILLLGIWLLQGCDHFTTTTDVKETSIDSLIKIKEEVSTFSSLASMEHNSPEVMNLDSSKLHRSIDKIVARAIRKKAMPGCQILVAKQGKVVFQKSYGHFTYDKKIAVDNAHLYDLASITKVASTTLALMYLYENGKIKDINDRLSTYLGETNEEGERSRIKNIRLRYLMTHRSGLPVGFPILNYVRYQDTTSQEYWNNFSHQFSSEFSEPITDNFFIKKELQSLVWNDIQRSKLSKRGSFQYSDINFFVLQKVIEELSQMPLNEFVSQKFYEPLALQSVMFRPLERFKKDCIVPTELDKKWRNQQIHGTVHDEGSAFMGGVAGHAGLFGTAQELAIIGQLLLNGGEYNGQRFLKKETVDYFTSSKHGNYRGLGFDRKSRNGSGYYYGASKSTFGHNGYTGTCFWIDPVHELVYIFLSNRVYPEKHNDKLMKLKVRENIHRAVYKAMK